MKAWIVGLWEGTWIVGLLRDESLDSRAVRRNLDSRVVLVAPMITLFIFECWSWTCWKLLIITVFHERNTWLVMCDAWDALWWGSQNDWDYVICNVCTCHDVWTWNADVIIWVRENKSLTAVWRVGEMVFLTAIKNIVPLLLLGMVNKDD